MKRKKEFKLVGVRFIGSARVYTYKVPVKTNVALGDLLYVESPIQGAALVAVVQLNAPLPAGYSVESLKRAQGKVVLI